MNFRRTTLSMVFVRESICIMVNFKHIAKQELNLYLHASSKIISFDLAQNLVTRCLYSAVEENKTQVNHMAQ